MFTIIFYIQASIVLLLDLYIIICDFASDDVDFGTLLCILAFLAMAAGIVLQIVVGYPWGGLSALISWAFSIYTINKKAG
jgi:hypothetical protein